MSNLLDLNHSEAKEYFLRSNSYCNIDLPKYFSFTEILDKVSTFLSGKDLYSCIDSNKKPYQFDDVNYSFLNNKDGALSWRPFRIIHPAFYVQIVNTITDTNNWDYITKRFAEFRKNEKIICYSLPFVSSDFLTEDKTPRITHWWMNIEQQSIRLALEYDYIVHTDITNCYGSIYTHSIAWALHNKEVCKGNKTLNILGNKLDKYLRDMSFGQTNGLPQGSNLMDFIAEIVLGYADMLLSEKIADTGIKEYKILRYRDDYRIFTTSEHNSKILTKLLMETLLELRLSLNSQKTFQSSNIIRSSIKEDKWYWINHKQGNKSIQTHLLLIYDLSEKYPNSGSLRKSLKNFYERISTNQEENLNDYKVLISIIVNLMLKNPSAHMISTAILSLLFIYFEKIDEAKATLELIREKFNNVPNTGHLEVWLQRMTINYDKHIKYKEKLTKKVLDKNIILWNSEWISSKTFRNIINSTSIVLKEEINTVENIITSSEIKFFFTGFSYDEDPEEIANY